MNTLLSPSPPRRLEWISQIESIIKTQPSGQPRNPPTNGLLLRRLGQKNTVSSIQADLEIIKNGYSDSESEDESPQQRPIQRASSLKTGKSPPCSPSQQTKKIVRFADVLGLDLFNVKVYKDEIPKVPKCAFRDLEIESPVEFEFIPSFVPQFVLRRVTYEGLRDGKVLLSSVSSPVPNLISGRVRVLNVDFHKSVWVRWTTDDWVTHEEVQATYTEGSSDGFSDEFSFAIATTQPRVQLAVRYHAQGSSWWDNNRGSNYLLLSNHSGRFY